MANRPYVPSHEMQDASETRKVRAAKPARTASEQVSSIAALAAPQAVTVLAAAIRKQLVALGRCAVQRSLIAELERYDRAISLWPSVPPAQAQSSAMLEQLMILSERAQAREATAATQAGPGTTKQPLTGAPPKTTTKMPRVSRAQKLPSRAR